MGHVRYKLKCDLFEASKKKKMFGIRKVHVDLVGTGLPVRCNCVAKKR